MSSSREPSIFSHQRSSGRTANKGSAINLKIKNTDMKNKTFLIISFLAATFMLSSCLKDKVGEDWTSSLKGKMYAEVWNGGFAALALQPVADSVTFKFLVNIATDALPTEDITLTIGLDTAVIRRYNTAKKLTGTKAYKLYPYISIKNKTVVIKKGTRNAYVHVKVWHADLLNACDNFMAPIAILSATGGVVVADHLNTGARLMALPINNPYAATYNTVGYRIRPGNATEPIVAQEVFSTVDCKTVIKQGFGNYGTYYIKIEVPDITVPANQIVVNGTTCVKVSAIPVDANGAVVGDMFTTWTGDAATPPTPPTDNTWINYYNPVTRQFVLNCYYLSSAGNRIMYEVHTRI
jgi:hypothetical protein